MLNSMFQFIPQLATRSSEINANAKVCKWITFSTKAANGSTLHLVATLFCSFIFIVYLFSLQRLDDLLHAHLQILDVVFLRLQQLLDHLGPLLQHPLLGILRARAGRRGGVRRGAGVQGFGLGGQERHLWADGTERGGNEFRWKGCVTLLLHCRLAEDRNVFYNCVKETLSSQTEGHRHNTLVLNC